MITKAPTTTTAFSSSIAPVHSGHSLLSLLSLWSAGTRHPIPSIPSIPPSQHLNVGEGACVITPHSIPHRCTPLGPVQSSSWREKWKHHSESNHALFSDDRRIIKLLYFGQVQLVLLMFSHARNPSTHLQQKWSQRHPQLPPPSAVPLLLFTVSSSDIVGEILVHDSTFVVWAFIVTLGMVCRGFIYSFWGQQLQQLWTQCYILGGLSIAFDKCPPLEGSSRAFLFPVGKYITMYTIGRIDILWHEKITNLEGVQMLWGANILVNMQERSELRKCNDAVKDTLFPVGNYITMCER